MSLGGIFGFREACFFIMKFAMYLLCELDFCFKIKLDLYRDILSSDY